MRSPDFERGDPDSTVSGQSCRLASERMIGRWTGRDSNPGRVRATVGEHLAWTTDEKQRRFADWSALTGTVQRSGSETT